MRKPSILVVVFLLAGVLPSWAATVRVKANQAPLRAEATSQGRVLERLDAGVELELIDVERDWYRVRNPRTKVEGFILASLVELLPGPGKPAGTGPGTPAKPAPGIAKPPTRAAQPAPAKPGEWRDLGYITASGLFQPAGDGLSDAFTWTQYAEAASAAVRYGQRAGVAVDVGGGWRVWRNLAVGGAVSALSRSDPASAEATIPHPLYIQRGRVMAGTFSAERTEVGVHVQAAWFVPVGRRVLLSLSGGPSYMRVTQTVATGILFSSAYPYDAIEFSGAETSRVSRGGVGFNAGVDVGFFLTRNVGIGALVRFSRATVDLPAGGSIRTNAGGVQAGVGIRVRLAHGTRRPAPRPPVKAPAPRKPATK